MAGNLSEDVLALVFHEFANDQVLRWPDAEYDHAMALAPYTLAAVCQRWRCLALSLAPIWAYFGFPNDPHALHLHHSRLLALLDRSKDALVDVVVTMGTAYNYRSYDRNPKIWGDILTRLGRVVRRWRNVRLRLPETIAVHFKDVLQETAPHLISLSIVIDAQWHFIPHSPQLKRLYIEAIYLDDEPPQFNILPQLQTLALLYNPAMARNPLWTRNLKQIVDLCIMDTTFTLHEDIILIFPCLKTLTTGESSFLRAIQAPNLRSLALKADSLEGTRDTVDIFGDISATVTELTLFGRLTKEGAVALQPLSHIQTLRFRSPTAFQTCFPTNIEVEHEYSYEDGVSAVMLSSFSPMWPNLQHIHFHQPSQPYGAAVNCRDLLEFVTLRNSVSPTTNTTPTARLTAVIVHPDVFHVDDLGMALAEGLLRLGVIQYSDS